MDGVFMKKILKLCCLLLAVGFCMWICGVFAEGQTMKENLVRLHIVANSDSDADQALKLQVRDAVVENLQTVMQNIPSAEEAKTYLQEHLEQLEDLVNRVIQEAGFREKAQVTLAREAFDTRDYETFSLPAGVYDSLRITIGKGEGKNWWCVVFPTLCLPATTEGFGSTAVGSGFSENMTNTLQREDGYEMRFFLLDCLGKIENFFFRR